MAVYCVGDVHGCLLELQQLLRQVDYQPKKDQIWFTGDLVNRGPASLATLRFIRSLPDARVVLGNHDLHLLSVYTKSYHKLVTPQLQEIVTAPDSEELIDWLRHCPLCYYDQQRQIFLTHAGLFPGWSLLEAQQYAAEVHEQLRSAQFALLLQNMYGNTPTKWDPSLTGWERSRFIVNAFTRMRFCTTENELDFVEVGDPGSAPSGLIPWFMQLPKNLPYRLVFGHWAALNGYSPQPTKIIPLDTGAAWGGALTMINLDTLVRISCPRLAN